MWHTTNVNGKNATKSISHKFRLTLLVISISLYTNEKHSGNHLQNNAENEYKNKVKESEKKWKPENVFKFEKSLAIKVAIKCRNNKNDR